MKGIFTKKGILNSNTFISDKEYKVIRVKNRSYQEGEVYALIEHLGKNFILLDSIRA